MDYKEEKIVEKQLIELIKKIRDPNFAEEDALGELKKIRAFSYVDQMKLKILELMPFTMWASDEKYQIKFWELNCETFYKSKKEDSLNKNYLDHFFVSDIQKPQAKRDHKTIIKGRQLPFYNIAHDVDTEGNTVDLITICHRIEDINQKDNFWLVEVGVKVDIEDLEKKYDREELEYKNITNRLKRFWDDTRECGKTCFEKERECEDILDDYQITYMELERYENIDLKKKKKEERIINTIQENVKHLTGYIEKCRVISKDIIRMSISDDEVDKTRDEFEQQHRSVLIRYDKIIRRLKKKKIEVENRISMIKAKKEKMLEFQEKVKEYKDRIEGQLITHWKETNAQQNDESKKLESITESLQNITVKINSIIREKYNDKTDDIFQEYQESFEVVKGLAL